MYIPGSEELVVFFMAFIGALIGFFGIMLTLHKCLWETQEALLLVELLL